MSRVLSNELGTCPLYCGHEYHNNTISGLVATQYSVSAETHPSFVVLLHSFMCGHIVTSEDWFCCAESALCFAQTSPERLVMVVAMLRLLRENKQSVYLIICHSC